LAAVTRYGAAPIVGMPPSQPFHLSARADVTPVRGLDLKSVPWSRYGSYLALSTLVHADALHGAVVTPGLYLHDLSGNRMWQWNGVFRVDLLHDDAVVTPHVDEATPGRVRLIGGDGNVEVAWDGPNVLRFRGTGVGLRLTQSVTETSALAFPVSDRTFRLAMGVNLHFAATVLNGDATVAGLRTRTASVAADTKTVFEIRPGSTGSFELALEAYEASWQMRDYPRTFASCVTDVDTEFAAWLADTLRTPPEFEDARTLAAYINWSCVVAPRGAMPRAGVLMSKNWMHGVWSWDHCFNAMALASGRPSLAWDQFMLPFDVQHEQGALPDRVHDNGQIWGFVKPPIHGWTLRHLERSGVLTDARRREIYPRLARWTQWWLTYRDDDRDGLGEYLHGNDSGWDNATAFDMGFPAEGPDLAAFLVIQMDVLADLARKLGRPAESRRWAEKAEAMLTQLLTQLWDGNRFRAVRSSDHISDDASQSLVPYLPIVLGARLPADIRAKLVSTVQQSGLLTPFGPASERPESPLYRADGYWRGPIWAPTTALLVDGLAACGAKDLAVETVRRFARTCRANGFAENFEATSGRALRDPAYTWTSSAFLSLVNTYLT
jgi:putative isomerase